MLIRIRAPFGTPRVEVNNNASVKDLKRVVFSLLQQEKVAVTSEDDIFLSLDPSGASLLLDNDASLSSSNVSHGTMLYLIMDAPPSASSSRPTPSTSNTQPSELVQPKCTHPPNAKCVHCSSAQAPPPPAPKTTGTGKKIKWLCTHPPGAKCVNCMRPPKKNATLKCTHPSYMVCPNCIGDAKDTTKTNGTTPKIDKSHCNHGPNGACPNCRPVVEEDLVSTRCRNHGPNGSCIECIEREDRRKLRLKLQDTPHCIQALVDFQAANTFQSYLQEHRFRIQRCGFLYGKFNDDGSSSVEVIYEPPQRSEKDQIVILPDPDEDRVEKIASLLGFTRVGWIFSHPARAYVMSSTEIQRAAEFQIKYGERFVTLILSVNEKGQGNLEAFQVSDQAVKLAQQNMFLPSTDLTKCRFQNPVYVEGAETTVADYHFFLVTVSVKSKDKGLLKADFPVENREQAQARSDLKVHLMHHAKRPFIEQVSDFHFLLFLSKGYLDLNTDFPTLCEAIIYKRPQDLEGFKFLLDNYLN
eukprot:Phypoly_transcript_07040.p1 GENE.Phypoly_transcript_07040~~Phypoly_transcript_07040.p1  ORF type:complete len:525 (+),score=46.80 Phypoly_transcript_07040:86-1660(+)